MEKRKFNLTDIIIVLFVAAVVAVSAYMINRYAEPETGETKTIVLEVTSQKKAFCDAVKKDDIAYDGVQNVELGRIVDYEIKPAVTDSVSLNSGEVVRAEIPDRYDVFLKIEVPKESDVRVGKQLWVETSIIKCSGYILEVNE